MSKSQAEAHRLYLASLVRQERQVAYRRHDYLSRDWQTNLWNREVKGMMHLDAVRQSPSSVIPSENVHVHLPSAPSEICVRWREKIIEWMYQVIDRYGEK